MKKTYYDLLNEFYALLESENVSNNAQLLYYTLLQINNRTGWTEWFYRTNINICGLMRVSEKALTNAKNELRKLELIDFVSSKKRGDCTKYSILNYSKESTKEEQKKYKRRTEEVQRKNRRSTKEEQKKYKRNTKEEQRVDINKDIDKEKDSSSSLLTSDLEKLENEKTEEEETIKIIETYKTNINPLPTAIECQYIRQWLNEVEPEVVIMAIEVAVLNNGRNLNYIKRVIDNWICEGLTTQVSVKLHLDNWAKSRGNSSNKKADIENKKAQYCEKQQAELLANIERRKAMIQNDNALI